MKPRCAGFSLVELMLAMTLALLLTGAIISVFVGSRSAYQSTSGLGVLSDSGRFALDLIGESARGAGFLACNSAMTATSQTLTVNSFASNFSQGVTGFEANGTGTAAALTLPSSPAAGATGDWTPNLDAAVTGATPGPAGRPVKGSDVLVLRSSVPRVAPVYTSLDAAPGATDVFVTPVPSGLQAGQYGVVSDCTKSVIFQTGGVAGGAAPADVSLGGALPVGFSAGALVSPLTTTVYYIGVGSDGDGALWRLEQVNGPNFTAEELVPDVESMQVLYGIDPTGTQTASAYVTADQVGATSVVSIQVAVLAASPAGSSHMPAAPAYNLLGTQVSVPQDSRLRKVFFATINLRDAVN